MKQLEASLGTSASPHIQGAAARAHAFQGHSNVPAAADGQAGAGGEGEVRSCHGQPSPLRPGGPRCRLPKRARSLPPGCLPNRESRRTDEARAACQVPPAHDAQLSLSTPLARMSSACRSGKGSAFHACSPYISWDAHFTLQKERRCTLQVRGSLRGASLPQQVAQR